MSTIFDIFAICLGAIVLFDVFITVFTASSSGPLTRWWNSVMWKGLLFVHKRRRVHTLLALAGPFMLVVTILLWYALLGLSLFISLAAHPGSVIDSATDLPVNLLQKFYFVGTTITSLGYGDLIPSGPPWTVICTLCTLMGTVVITISLSYVLSVLMAAIEGRKLAQSIFSLGSTVPEIISNVRLHEDRNSLKNYILNISSEIDSQALKHLAYPILKFFHAKRPESSISMAVLLLSDTFFVLKIVPENLRPPIGVQKVVQGSISNYLGFRGRSLREEGEIPQYLIEAAYEVGGPKETNQEDQEALADYAPTRNKIVALCREDGWLDP